MSRTEETHECVFFWLLEAHLANPQLLVPSILQCDVVSCGRRHAISSHMPHNLGFCGCMGGSMGRLITDGSDKFSRRGRSLKPEEEDHHQPVPAAAAAAPAAQLLVR